MGKLLSAIASAVLASNAALPGAAGAATKATMPLCTAATGPVMWYVPAMHAVYAKSSAMFGRGKGVYVCRADAMHRAHMSAGHMMMNGHMSHGAMGGTMPHGAMGGAMPHGSMPMPMTTAPASAAPVPLPAATAPGAPGTIPNNPAAPPQSPVPSPAGSPKP